jgi:hypothetical protein
VGDQVRHRSREECIQVNLDSRYVKWSISNTFYLVIGSRGRSQGRMKWRRHKNCCIRQDQESTLACKGQKSWLSRRINLHRSQGWCKKVGPPRLQRPQRVLIWRKEKKSSYRL